MTIWKFGCVVLLVSGFLTILAMIAIATGKVDAEGSRAVGLFLAAGVQFIGAGLFAAGDSQ